MELSPSLSEECDFARDILVLLSSQELVHNLFPVKL